MSGKEKKAIQEINSVWREKFGVILRALFDIYEVNDVTFSEYSNSINYTITDSAVRKWFLGKRIPQKQSFQVIIRFFEMLNKSQKDDKKVIRVYATLEDYFSEQNLSDYYSIKERSTDVVDFIREILQYCSKNSKEKKIAERKCVVHVPSGHTKAVIFDFDGTLTYGKTNRTTWESIWTSLGYDVSECQELQMRFMRGEFSHAKWCKLTEDKFVAKHLHKVDVENIAKKIKLLPGVRETFSALEKANIHIYIVSGSIFDVIKKVLYGSVYHYIDGIKANHFFYNDNGVLLKIVGTKYDFEGKADFIREIAEELEISTNDILFVGNSFNDRFAYQSGATTLCINPKDTDPTNCVVWNYCINDCKNLQEILNFVKR